MSLAFSPYYISITIFAGVLAAYLFKFYLKEKQLMIHFNQEKLDSLHNIFKINLINSCSGYKPANLIATVSKKGFENVAIFSSVVHVGSNPPLLGFIVRPSGEVPRNTYTRTLKKHSFIHYKSCI